jgi:hypothetical protein
LCQIAADFRLLDIYNFDIVERTVTANILHHLTWPDDRISLRHGCNSQILHSDIFSLIWFPDLDIDHGRNFKIKSISSDQKFVEMRRPSRPSDPMLVSYNFAAAVTISCSMDLDRYPFADTTCKYRLVSQSLDSTILIFRTSPVINISSSLDTQEFV